MWKNLFKLLLMLFLMKDPLLKVSEMLGTNPMKCVYVGNKGGHDVIAAQRADMTPVLLTWCDPDEIEKAPENTIMISHIRKLPGLLQ